MRVAGLIFAMALVGRTYAGHCNGDSASYRIMPPTFGREHETMKTPFQLPCDSMVVPAGKTTVIHASSMVYFGENPLHNSKICVQGSLRVLGEKDHPVFFSASIQPTPGGYAPGTQTWDGIEVDNGATLDFRYARLYNAPTAMTLMSRKVRIIQSYFQGSSGLILPDTNLFLNTHGTTLDTLDLGKPLSIAAQGIAGKPVAKDSAAAGTHVSGKKLAWYTVAGAGVLVASGLAWYALRPEANTPSSSPTNLLDSLALPQKPKPQQ